jgi:DNA-binding transcriptional ArsR family regulator
MEQLLTITKALADGNRVRVLGALRHEELCVCQIIELLGLAPSTISKHLSILRSAHLIDNRKQGRWMYYRLTALPGTDVAAEALNWVFRNLEGSAQFIEDQQRLARILEMDPEILCKRQSGGESCGTTGARDYHAKARASRA